MQRTVKQYSKEVDKLTMDELKSKAGKTGHLMNYTYTRFNGNKSYYLIHTASPTYIRDKILGKEVCSNFGLMTRSISNTIRDAIRNLNSNWTNTLNLVQEQVNRRTKGGFFTNHESHYVYTILKYLELTHCVLNNWKFENFEYYSERQKNFILNLPALLYKDINRKKLNNWARRNIQKYKSPVPIVNKVRQFPIENFSIKNNILKIEGLKSYRRPKIKLTDSRKLHPIRLVIKGKKVEIHNICNIKIIKPEIKNTVGIDKGFRTLVASSSGNQYGEEFNNLVIRKVSKRTEKGKFRSKLRFLENKYEEQGKIEKSGNIRKYNLGDKKFEEISRKSDEHTKNFINESLNTFFRTEKPSEIVCEDLTNLQTRRDSGFSKKVNNYLNHWQKGYLQSRLQFKAEQNGGDLTVVNSAYTSQICSSCGQFGERNGDIFYCSCAGNVSADVNAAKNILARKYDSEIKTWMSPKLVKDILLKRIELSKLDQVDESHSWTPKTLDTDVGDMSNIEDCTVNQRANLSYGESL